MSSTAVPLNYVTTVVGYNLDKGYYNESGTNLPQNINILGEANTANQSGLSLLGTTITSAKQAADLYGWGSPIYSVARILFPANGSGVSIPVKVYPQLAASGAVAKVITITPTGTASASGTIYLRIAGRTSLDGGSYAISIVSGDTPTAICNKFRAAIAAVLGCPVTGSGTTTFIATAKWEGLTSNDINIAVDLNGTSLGTTYAVVNTTAGAGTPSVVGTGNGLTLFGNEWRTLVINTYGLVAGTMTELEEFNGIPTPGAPTGRYGGLVWKPFLALSGTCLDNPTSITSAGARPDNVTIVPCVAPLSLGMPYEAAANVAYRVSNIFQNAPQSDVIDQAYPDMPAPTVGNIPAMNDVTVRQSYVTQGCSTVDFTGGVYVIKDLVTTYNKSGEFPPFYRWARDLNIHFNIRFGYMLLEAANLVGKTITKDSAVVTAANVIKPRMWKAIVAAYMDDLEARALIADKAFSKASITVTINSSNPNRIDTTFSDKITGVVRISSTTETGGFNFSN